MKWKKQGLIFCPDGSIDWAKHSAITPTPILINEATIRVFAGFRNEKGVSRIGFVDVSSDNPSCVKRISKVPVLDIGKPGTFDDNGVILGDIIYRDGKVYMYYVGFQLVQRVKFFAFTGLAVSNDNGDHFIRLSNAPILDRSSNELYIRAIHTVLFENGKYKAWAGVGNSFIDIKNKPYPQYDIKYYESDDGIHFSDRGNTVIHLDTSREEYRIGRPRVYKEDNIYKMFFTYGTIQGDYLPGYAESPNGIDWTRMDECAGITVSENKNDWDSLMCCYPTIIKVKHKTYMFYNGNDYGKTGFGYAELMQ